MAHYMEHSTRIYNIYLKYIAPEDIQRNEADEEIARRLRDGESYRTIMKEMGISPKTIQKVKNKMAHSNND